MMNAKEMSHWLIQFPHGSGQRLRSVAWWSGGINCTGNAESAVRFARREDAEKTIAASNYLTKVGAIAIERSV